MAVLVSFAFYDEGERVAALLKRFPPRDRRGYDLLAVDDASRDGAWGSLPPELRARVDFYLRHPRNRGIGAGLQTAFRFALERGYQVIVVVAGNDKDDPRQIPTLVAPILEERADLVQGSRYLPGGGHANMPLYRVLATRYLHPWICSLATGRRLTDSTNGFRALHVRLLQDPRLHWEEPALWGYELEPFLYLEAIRLGYRTLEVPVTKTYPRGRYSKIPPITGWWALLRPALAALARRWLVP